MDNRLDLTRYEGHTPGPWKWDGDDLRCPEWEVFMILPGGPARDDRPCLEFDDNIKIENADRALIEDAPTLLSALEAAYAEIDRMRALLTKATQGADAHAPAWAFTRRRVLAGKVQPGSCDGGGANDEDEVKE